MMDEKIREGYDCMTPGQANRERMLEGVLKGGNSMKKYTGSPVQSKRWMEIPAIAALIAVVLIGAFVLGRLKDNPVSQNDPDNIAAPGLDIIEEEPSIQDVSVPPEDIQNSEAPTITVVTPLPSSVLLSDQNDQTLAVSLENGDAYVDNNGAMQMKLTVYDYELFDMVDISLLEVGNYIMIRGKEVAVQELQHTESGAVLINGGLEQGGYELRTDENTVYYEVGSHGAPCWYVVGEVEYKVSPDFIYTDSFNPRVESQVFYPGDFLIGYEGLDYFFSPNTTRIVLEDGYIVSMVRNYFEPDTVTYRQYAEFIDDRISNADHPEDLYYYLTDVNGDGSLEMLIGYNDHLEAVYTVADGDLNFMFLEMTDEDWQTADEIWAEASITPITEWED